MGIVQQITKDNYMVKSGDKVTRIWPIDTYDVRAALPADASEYHILRVPLLGQHYDRAGGKPKTGADAWCGRTAASMAHNWYALLKDGDPKERYISHWDQSKGYYLDLRLPSGPRAFHKHPTDPPFDADKDGVAVGAPLQSDLKFTANYVDPYPSTAEEQKARMERAQKIAASKHDLDKAFSKVLTALRSNNPVVFFSGFSTSSYKRHVILLCGYMYIPDSGQEHLWFVVANPSTHGRLIQHGLLVPFVRGKDEKLGPEHSVIILQAGDWDNARSELSLIRARRFFEPNRHSTTALDLHMDYWDSDESHSGKGGLFYSSETPVAAPAEALISSRSQAAVAFPFDGKIDAPSPVRYLFLNETQYGGYYPLGLYRNIHGGVHLRPVDTKEPLAPVRCLAPGYVVAARLTNGLPPALAGGDREGGAMANVLAREIAGGGSSFVLVRHMLETRPTDKSDPRRFTFYTLSMHLAAPDWSQIDAAKAHAAVPWLDKLVRRRNGSVLVIDPSLVESGRRYLPTRPVEAKLLAGGMLEAYGATFAEQGSFSIGPAEAGRTTAVARAAEPDIKEALDALAAGKVLTFCGPSLPVKRGETLGHVPGDGKSFLHWEVLAPAGAKDGLEELFAHAAKELGLGEEFFTTFTEETSNNFLEPKDGEVEELLASLPDEDGDKASKLDAEYEWYELVQLMKSPAALTFAAEKPPDAAAAHPGELAYPLTLLFDDFRGAMPAGERTLTMRFEPPSIPPRPVKFDPKKGKVVVMVPAGAKKIFLEASGFFLELVDSPLKLHEDAGHFKRLAGARLRRVLLQHLNAWSKDGLIAEMKARFANKDEELDAYAAAIAFWANQEEAVIGEDGEETPLFADSPDEKRLQLPAKTKLAHAHPVIAAWAANLLVKHERARFVDEFPPVQGAEASEKLFYLGWMPAVAAPRARPVGAIVHAVAVAAEDVNGTREITLQARLEGAAAPLVLARGRYAGGVLSAPVACPFWGKATLEVPAQSPEHGNTSLEVLTPTLTDLPAPTVEGAKHVWDIHFSESCPARIEGFVVMETWVVEEGKVPEGPGTEARVAIPIEALPPPPAKEGDLSLDVTGHFIVGAKSRKTEISYKLAFSEYKDVFKGTDFQLAKVLAERVGSVRAAYLADQKKAGVKQTGVSPRSLDADGLGVVIACSSYTKENHKRLLAAAEAMKDAFTTVEDREKEIYLAVAPPPESVGGLLRASFDPTAALNKLREAPLGPKDEMHVRFGVIFQNGGRLLRAPASDSPGVGYTEVAASTLRREAPSVLEAWAPAPTKKLRKPQFGAFIVSVVNDTLTLSVPLHGNPKDWAGAKPEIVFKSKTGKEAPCSSKTKGNMLTGTILLGDKRVAGANIRFEVRVTNAKALFDGQQLAIAPVSCEQDTSPALGKPDVAWTDTDLEVRCTARSFPTNRILELLVYKISETGAAEDTGLGMSAMFDHPYVQPNTKKKYQGFPDERGQFVARVGRAIMAGKLAAGDKIKVVLRRPEGSEALLGTTIAAVEAEDTVPGP